MAIAKKSKKIIYLDHAATTPLDPVVKRAMDPFWSRSFGNPSSLYGLGREARDAVERARQTTARLLNARPSEIVFTAGGTDSVNLALFGAVKLWRRSGGAARPRVIVSAVEHHAVLNTCRELEREGCEVAYVPVDKFGLVNLSELEKAIRPETAVVSVMYANNEIGTVEPIAEISKIVRRANSRRPAGAPHIVFHTDACQAAGSLDMDVQKLGVDLLSANGSKIYGPKQTGFLYVRSGITLEPLVYGGGQERGLRSGTENVPGVTGLAAAFELAQKRRLKENARQRKLRDYFITRLLRQIPGAVLNGPDERGYAAAVFEPRRLPNNVNVSFLGVDGEALVLYLDARGIAASTGSACASGSTEPSHVIEAIGRPPEYTKGSIRFTLGKDTTKPDVNYALKVLAGLVAELRKMESVK